MALPDTRCFILDSEQGLEKAGSQVMQYRWIKEDEMVALTCQTGNKVLQELHPNHLDIVYFRLNEILI